MPRRDRPILEDLLSYAEEAVAFVEARDGAALEADRMRLLAAVRAAEVVGEAANQLSVEAKASVPYDLSPAIAMRHRLIHGYSTVSAEIVASTVRKEFPALIAAVKAALSGPLPGDT